MKIIIKEKELQEILTKYLKEKGFVPKAFDIKINTDWGGIISARLEHIEIEL